MVEDAQLVKLNTKPMNSIPLLVSSQLLELMNLDFSHLSQQSILPLEQVLWKNLMTTVLLSIWLFKKFQIPRSCSLVNLHSLLATVCQVQVGSQMLLLKTVKLHLTQETSNHKSKNRYLSEHCVLLSEILNQDSLNKLYVNLSWIFIAYFWPQMTPKTWLIRVSIMTKTNGL